MGICNTKPAAINGTGGLELLKDDIIIKCPLEEMIKYFFKDYVIVWHDPDLDSQENQSHSAQLEAFCKVFTFTEWEKAKEFIQEANEICHVITSGTNGEILVKEIFEKENVCNIYVFCGDKEIHEIWAQNYQKVQCVETDLKIVLNQIQESLQEWLQKEDSLKMNLPAFTNEMNNKNCEVPNFKNPEQAKEDFLDLSKALYSDAQNIASFEKDYNEYNKSQMLRWYIQDSFVSKVTNNCLRMAIPDSINYSRLILKDLEKAIKDQYRAKSKTFNGLLYKGASLSQEQWSYLKENQDKDIEMHGFLSVSKEKDVVEEFVKGGDPTKMALITIILPQGPSEEEQGFAEIEEFSHDKEVLFNLKSRFTVLEAEDKYSEEFPYRHVVLLYGAQGFRKFMTEKSPIHEISIAHPGNDGEEGAVGASKKLLFVSLKTGLCYDKKYLDDDSAPFLCIPMTETTRKPDLIKIKGCCLLMSSSQQQTPFYGYKCENCEAKKQKMYFVCTDCGTKEKRWCENCFEEKALDCLEVGHNVLLETSPFSFWCEKMSTDELTLP